MWGMRIHFCPDAQVLVMCCCCGNRSATTNQTQSGCWDCWNPWKYGKDQDEREYGDWAVSSLVAYHHQAALPSHPHLCVSTLGHLGWRACRCQDSIRMQDAPHSAQQAEASGTWREQAHFWIRARRILRDHEPCRCVMALNLQHSSQSCLCVLGAFPANFRGSKTFWHIQLKWSKVEGALIQSIIRYCSLL